MTWIVVVAVSATLLGVTASWAVRRASVALARAVVSPRPRPATRIHSSTGTSVTLAADRRTLHRGQFGLWFGQHGHATHGHAVVGHVTAFDREAGTVTRELLEVSGDLSAAQSGRWTGHLHAGPESLRRPYQQVEIEVPGGVAPAWVVEPRENRRPGVWAIHIHGQNAPRVTVLGAVHATDSLGMTSLVVAYRGDGEGPPVPAGASLLGLREWEDVDAAVAWALSRGAQRVVLVGWSLGGTIALQLAELGAHRASIDRLVLIAPVTDWRAAIRNIVAERGLPRALGSLAIRALADPGLSARAGLPEPLDFDRLDWSRPGRLTVPALVIHSDGDRSVPLSSSVLFAMANPRLVRLVELSRAEHCWEYNVDPAAFNRAVIDFLAPAREDDRLG
ncbi:alpha/beta hydrolase family protein [Leifsonia sp. 2TAF2]|uniref:alpha/beta hydrolase family protein n=1 Tax=Leifsonia sp. 2TAF2 TaxID=3233009 RepID=UPI003F9CF88E